MSIGKWQLLRGRRTAGLVVGGTALLLAVTAGGVAVAASAGSSSIHGCVSTKTRALTVPKAGKCPRGTTVLTWNVAGPAGKAGPAGISQGVQVFSNTKVPISPANTGIGVAHTPAASTSGDYYVSASLSGWISAGDFVYCWISYAPVGDVAEVTMPSSGGNYQSLSLTGDVPVTAGSSVEVACESPNGVASTYINSADISAVLINNNNGSTATVTRGPRVQPMPRLPRAHSAS